METRLPAIVNQPWAILDAELERLADIRALTADALAPFRAAADARFAAAREQSGGGIIVLPIFGVITPRVSILSEFLGGTALDRFRANFRRALGDPGVKAIVLDVDSPGGQIDGVMETAEEIFQARGRKRVIAVADTLAASAAYWLAAAASEVVASPSASVGSIGVYALHLDFSRQVDAAGVKPTFISAGKYKVEGNEFTPLGEEARAALQRRVDEAYDVFVRDVARFRGIDPRTVRAGYGQGRVLSARQARAEGMIDRIDTLDHAALRIVRANTLEVAERRMQQKRDLAYFGRMAAEAKRVAET